MMMTTVTFRSLDISALDQLEKIEQRCMPAPWSRGLLAAQLASAETLAVGAFRGDLLCGAVVAYRAADQVHILSVAVLPEVRRQGIARELLVHLLGEAGRCGAAFAFLEVRESNFAARRLYERLGFSADGVRIKYYRDTGEDALLLSAPVALPVAHFDA